jgi:hypothetical protein
LSSGVETRDTHKWSRKCWGNGECPQSSITMVYRIIRSDFRFFRKFLAGWPLQGLLRPLLSLSVPILPTQWLKPSTPSGIISLCTRKIKNNAQSGGVQLLLSEVLGDESPQVVWTPSWLRRGHQTLPCLPQVEGRYEIYAATPDFGYQTQGAGCPA